MARPQDKNLKAFGSGALTPEEEFAIRSKGGKAAQAARQQRKALSEMVQILAGTPITNKKTLNKLRKMGLSSEDLVRNTAVALAILEGAEKGNTYLIGDYRELLGEVGNAGAKKNNLLEAILASTAQEVDISGIPELQPPAESGADLVEPSEA